MYLEYSHNSNTLKQTYFEKKKKKKKNSYVVNVVIYPSICQSVLCLFWSIHELFFISG